MIAVAGVIEEEKVLFRQIFDVLLKRVFDLAPRSEVILDQRGRGDFGRID